MIPRLASSFARSAKFNQSLAKKLLATSSVQARHYADQVKTLGYQDRLGPLPVPDLKDTIEKFLKTAQPHLSEEEFKETKRKADELVKPGGLGEKLHRGLVERSQKLDSWFSDWWLDMAYLEYRERLPVWSSPGFSFPVAKFADMTDQLKYSASMIGAILEYKNSLDDQTLPPDMMGDQPLDMIQYYMLFGVHRFPETNKDRLEFNSKSRHIIVAHEGNFFKVNVYDSNGATYSRQKILHLLEEVVKASQKIKAGPKVGILTSEHRDKWSESCQLLTSSSPINAASVDEIAKSLFLFCLDGSTQGYQRTSDAITRTAHLALHGLGTNFNSSNRWFDKTLQFFVAADGESGLNLEHSPTDGVAVVAVSDFIIKRIKEEGFEKLVADVSSADAPKYLPFEVNSDQLVEKIREAEQSFQSLIDDLELEVVIFKEYGKTFIKSQKFSPDSYVQMAIQYAFYRIHNTPGAHYESGSTRLFRKGRTEVIRSCSNESINFAKAMMSKERTQGERYTALCEAIKGHSDYAKHAVRGLGVDRLLQGLRRQAQETNLPLPEIFADPGFTRSARMRLSTSQISGKQLGTFACYGPLQTDGYAVCYSIHNDCVLFAIASFGSDGDTSNKTYCETIQTCLAEMKNVCPAIGA